MPRTKKKKLPESDHLSGVERYASAAASMKGRVVIPEINLWVSPQKMFTAGGAKLPTHGGAVVGRLPHGTEVKPIRKKKYKGRLFVEVVQAKTEEEAAPLKGWVLATLLREVGRHEPGIDPEIT